MINLVRDAEIAQWLVDLYDGKTSEFDMFESGNGDSGICWATKVVPGITVLLLRGSCKPVDWLRDFVGVTTPWVHDTLGPIHPGFAIGMDRCWAEIRTKTKGPYIVAGHSLGAGRAAILTGLMIESNITPVSRVVFGEPKPGFEHLAKYISMVPTRNYRNGNGKEFDGVTDLPLTLPLEEYVHSSPLINVEVSPVGDTLQGTFKYHHMPLYAQGVAGK